METKMNKNEILSLTKFFQSNKNADETVLKFIKENVNSLNLVSSLPIKDTNNDFVWSPNKTHDYRFDEINFWYFFAYLVFAFDYGYTNDLDCSKEDCLNDVLDFMQDYSIIQLIADLLFGFQNQKTSINDTIKLLISNRQYIPLICVQFISYRKQSSFFNIDHFKAQLKMENIKFHQMVDFFFQKGNQLEGSDDLNKIPNDLLKLMNKIDKQF